MAIDFKTLTPDTSFGSGAFLFGADSQGAVTPSIYGVDDVFGYLVGLSNTWTGQQTFASGTITSSTPTTFTQTWNEGTTTFTAIKMDVTDTASAAGSVLMDLQVGSASKFKVDKNGGLTFQSGASAILSVAAGDTTILNAYGSGFGVQPLRVLAPGGLSLQTDAFLSRKAAANLRLGLADAAAPVAQTLSVQSVTGVENTAGADFTIEGSQGTGTGAGGSIIFKVAPAGTTGTGQNGLETAFRITSQRNFEFIGVAPSSLKFVGEAIYAWNTIATAPKAMLSQYGIRAAADVPIGFSNSTGSVGTQDVFIYRDDANTLALRNGGTNLVPVPQTFNIYNYWASASDYERGFIRWNSNTFEIGTAVAGSGTAKNIHLQTSGTASLLLSGGSNTLSIRLFTNSQERWHFQSDGHFVSAADNAYDIGAFGAGRPRRLYLGGGSLTGSQSDSSLEINPIWNTTGTPTAIKMDVTDTASASGSLLMDLQVGGLSKFSVSKVGTLTIAGNISAAAGGLTIAGAGFLTWSGRGALDVPVDGELRRTNNAGTSYYWLTASAADNLQLGATDAAAPVAQTLSVQSATGVADTAGADFTIEGSQGTGTGAGGSILFKVAPAGTTGTGQNGLENRLIISSPNVLCISEATSSATFSLAARANTNSHLEIKHSTNADGSGGSVEAYIGRVSGGIGVFDGAGNLVVGRPSGSTGVGISGTTTILESDAANTLALRNGANAQTFRVYNTYDGTNNEWGTFDWTSNSGYLTIGTKKSGSGTQRGTIFASSDKIYFAPGGGVTSFRFENNGHFVAGTDNNYDIGASGANRPRNLYIASNGTFDGVLSSGSLSTGSAQFSSNVAIKTSNTSSHSLTVNGSFGVIENTTDIFTVNSDNSGVLLEVINPNDDTVFSVNANTDGPLMEVVNVSNVTVFSVNSETNGPLLEVVNTSNTTLFSVSDEGSIELSSGLTVATLPTVPVIGMIARVTDGDSGLTFGNTIVNSGSGVTPYLVWYNGTNWTVIGA